jgi:hypothetical protein
VGTLSRRARYRAGRAPGKSSGPAIAGHPYRGPEPIRFEGERSPEERANYFLGRADYVRYETSQARQEFAEIDRRGDYEDRRRLAELLGLSARGVLDQLDQLGALDVLAEDIAAMQQGEDVPDVLRQAALELQTAIFDLRQIGSEANQVASRRSPEEVTHAVAQVQAITIPQKATKKDILQLYRQSSA